MGQMKKILFSTRLMAVLFILFALAMACGTFIESIYSTETARIWIYNSWWFELIIIFFAVNFAGNIFKYQLLKSEKWAILLLHISWILIVTGALVTRYVGYEGYLFIREGETKNSYVSAKTYLTLEVDGEINGEPKRKKIESAVLASEQGIMTSSWKNRLPWKDDFNGQKFKVNYAGYIKGARRAFSPDKKGKAFLKLVEASNGVRHDHYLEEGKLTNIHNILFAFNNFTPGAINLTLKDSSYTILPPVNGHFVRMSDNFSGSLAKDSIQPLMFKSLYTLGKMQFVIPNPATIGSFKMVKLTPEEIKEDSPDALILDLESEGKTKRVEVLGVNKNIGSPKRISLAGLDFYFSYGSKKLELPFSIKLNDFIAEKYPGTENGYSAFKSKITVKDRNPFDYEIFMNHVLDHKGYRFFQASFYPDEKGSILSINHDFWGTWITYIGYFMLYTGLIGIMFFGKTRFKQLGLKLKKLKENRGKIVALLILLLNINTINAQQDSGFVNIRSEEVIFDSIISNTITSATHAAKFGAMVIQDQNGRMKPVNTYASELLRKLSKKDTYNKLNADQVFLSMLQNPKAWYHTPFIFITKKNDSIRKILGVPSGKKYVKPADFFDSSGNFKFNSFLSEAYATNTPNQFQKAFKDYHLKLSLLNRVLDRDILKVFPLPDDTNNTWVSETEFNSGQLSVKDSLYAVFIKNAVSEYLLSLKQSQLTGNYASTDSLLNKIKETQYRYGSKIIPSDKKIKAEILYNKINIFQKLLLWYMIIGLSMFFLIIMQIFKNNSITDVLVKICVVIIILLFLFQSSGLIFRWYISGHAPWSDAYESVIYVSWATMAMGLILGRKSKLTLAATAFITSIILFGAHMNWLDPAIANLNPVLNSYWLIIHVAIIVGSYGPLTLGMILGVTSLFLILLTNKKNIARIKTQIKELTIINELTLTIGLVMLTIGNFLGGQWANESWGRYWGWDPKETWALISIMIYAFVLHMRLVPGLRGAWTFNFASIIAFSSIMMTYFGVNFYLTGLHSYASGDKVITPTFVFYSIGFVMLLGTLSLWKYKLYYKK